MHTYQPVLKRDLVAGIDGAVAKSLAIRLLSQSSHLCTGSSPV